MRIFIVKVEVGDEVRKGDAIAPLLAMKMEYAL